MAATVLPCAAVVSEEQSDSSSETVSSEEPDAADTDTSRGEDCELKIEDLRFFAQGLKGETEILKGVNAEVKSGRVLAIIGGSGAGKTTLLRSIVQENARGRCTGRISLNGCRLDRRVFRAACAYVAQEDVLWPALTVQETVNFAARLYQASVSDSKRTSMVKGLLHRTGLSACRHVMVGEGYVIKGISGGQRRRLSVAVELLKRPSLLVLDEPTSGLDSAAAEAVMGLLTKLAQECNTAIVCTIHQPSSYVFRQLDELLVLAGGRVCYFGEACNALSHFAGIGHPSDAAVNPAEFLLRITNTDFCSKDQVTRICDAWDAATGKAADDDEERQVPTESTISKRSKTWSAASYHRAGWGTQAALLAERTLRGNLRNPIAFLGRAALSSLTVAFVAFAYLGARDHDQEAVIDRIWAVMWMQQLPAFLCVGAVTTFGREYACFKKEANNGLYKPLSYFMADAVVNVPFWFFLSIVSILPMFLIIDMNWLDLDKTWLLITCLIGWTDTMAQLCGTFFSSPMLGTMAFILQTIVNMIFNGTLLTQVEHVPWVLRWLFTVVPSKYSFRSGVYLEFDGQAFRGFPECMQPFAMDHTEKPCWGPNGNVILERLQGMYPVLTLEDTLIHDVGVIVGELVVLKVVHLILLLCLSK